MKRMIHFAAVLAAALAAGSLAAPAAASEKRLQLGQEDEVVVDPASSYIFFRSAVRADVQFIREPTAEERREHEEARAAAYTAARTRYERQLARWQREETECRGNDAAYCRYRPERPALVSPETFVFAPLELSHLVSVGRSPNFTRAEGDYTYFMRVPPGTYSLYGSIAMNDNGPEGVCLCMGTLRFEAPAGRIVDLGEIRYGADTGREVPRRNMTTQMIAPRTDATPPLPERLAGLPVIQAELRAGAKIPNFFAVEIDRHPPVDGVLAYDRDRVVDLRAPGAPAAGN